MNQLELALKEAFSTGGDAKAANKAYLEFIKANFIIPIEKNSSTGIPAEGEPKVLYLKEDERYFLPVFTEMHYFRHWAFDIQDNIAMLKLSGVDLLKGIGEKVYACLNIGSEIYKEFNPSELARMRSIILKIFK